MGSVLNKRVPFSLLTVIIVMFSSCKADSKCEFKAIFNFGDSNSDTGGFWAAFPAQSGPWGMTYFKKPVGRASDLIIDFLGNFYSNYSSYISTFPNVFLLNIGINVNFICLFVC